MAKRSGETALDEAAGRLRLQSFFKFSLSRGCLFSIALFVGVGGEGDEDVFEGGGDGADVGVGDAVGGEGLADLVFGDGGVDEEVHGLAKDGGVEDAGLVAENL